MIFTKHSNVEGLHAFLGASNYHWLNYDEEKLVSVYNNKLAVDKGTVLHDFARQCIELKQKLPKSKNTLNMYVNDGIGFGMTPEQVLFYSENAFGTTDCICFRDDTLRIHDLKTGQTPAHMEQLEIYAALFCLEYHMKPQNLKFILRIYQSNEFVEFCPEPEEIQEVMDKIIFADKVIRKLKEQEI